MANLPIPPQINTTSPQVNNGMINSIIAYLNGTAFGAGSVTTVSVVSANGVSGSVANATTTPAIALSLGAITPTSVAASGSVTGSNLSGANTGDQNLFSSIPVSGQTTVTANSTTTALTFIAGTNVTITTDNTAKSVTINSTGGGGGSIGGSIASTQVAFGTASNTIGGSSKFTWDDTNNNLEIDGATAGYITVLTGNVAGIQMSTDHTSGSPHAAGWDMTLNGAGATNDLIGWTYHTGSSAQEQMRLYNAGGVLFGSPSGYSGNTGNRIQVNGDMNTNGNIFAGSYTGTTVDSYIKMNAATKGLEFSTDHSGGTPHAMGIDQTLDGTTTTNDLIFWDYRTSIGVNEKMRLINGGSFVLKNFTPLVLDSCATTQASLVMTAGTTPTSPLDGWMWYDGTDVKFRVGGTTKTFTLV